VYFSLPKTTHTLFSFPTGQGHLLPLFYSTSSMQKIAYPPFVVDYGALLPCPLKNLKLPPTCLFFVFFSHLGPFFPLYLSSPHTVFVGLLGTLILSWISIFLPSHIRRSTWEGSFPLFFNTRGPRLVFEKTRSLFPKEEPKAVDCFSEPKFQRFTIIEFFSNANGDPFPQF